MPQWNHDYRFVAVNLEYEKGHYRGFNLRRCVRPALAFNYSRPSRCYNKLCCIIIWISLLLEKTVSLYLTISLYSLYRTSGWNNYFQYTKQRNTETCSWKHCCRRKALSITYSECVFVALVIQQAMGMRSVILSSVASPAVPYFFHIIS